MTTVPVKSPNRSACISILLRIRTLYYILGLISVALCTRHNIDTFTETALLYLFVVRDSICLTRYFIILRTTVCAHAFTFYNEKSYNSVGDAYNMSDKTYCVIIIHCYIIILRLPSFKLIVYERRRRVSVAPTTTGNERPSRWGG